MVDRWRDGCGAGYRTGCEILSASNARRDLVEKLRLYAQSGIPHYWIVDVERQLHHVHRLTPDGYVIVTAAGRDEVVRAEPFEAIELRVGILFGDE
jgi:Uma2 family endonuclease